MMKHATRMHNLNQIRAAYAKANPLLQMQIGALMNPLIELLQTLVNDHVEDEAKILELEKACAQNVRLYEIAVGRVEA